MKKLYWGLAMLAACQQHSTEHQALGAKPAVEIPATQSAAPVAPAVAYTSGDRGASGSLDTLRAGRDLVLRLVPGSKNDFASLPSQPPFSEARAIRQQGNGRVRRVGHTLMLRPFNGPVLRFSDDTYQMRRDEQEERDTHCSFSGSVPGRPYWIVDSLQWERYQPFLINKYSGRTTLIGSLPEISPNRRNLLVAIPSLDGEGGPNGLQFWFISNQSVKPIWTRVLAHWQPQQVRWLDNRTIAIEQLRFEPKQDTTYVRLLLP